MNLELIYMVVLVKSSSGKAMDVSQDIKVQAWKMVPSSLENEEITGDSNKERCLDI